MLAVMLSGMSASVSPVAPFIVGFVRMTLVRESIFWERAKDVRLTGVDCAGPENEMEGG